MAKTGWWKFHDDVQEITKVERDSRLSSDIKTIIQKLKKVITHKLTHENIKHVTLQIDTEGDCEDVDCS